MTMKINDRTRLLRLYRNILLSDNIPCRMVKLQFNSGYILQAQLDGGDPIFVTHITEVTRLLAHNHGYTLTELD